MAGSNMVLNVVGNDKASKVFNHVGKSAGGMGRAMKKVGAVAAVGLLAGAAAAVKFGSDSIKAFKDAETQQAKLSAAFDKFPALADTNQAALQKLNSALQAKTKFEDDSIASGQATLATMGLTGKQITQLTPLVLDYAEKTGVDVDTAAKALGKSMNGQTKALKNVGINYKSTGDKAKDFANISALLEEKVGGTAEAMGDTAVGRAEILKNKFGDLQETVGAHLVPILTRLTETGLAVVSWITSKGLPAVKQFAAEFRERFGPAIKQAVEWIKTHAVAVFQILSAVVRDRVIPAVKDLGSWITGTGIPAFKAVVGWIQRNQDIVKSLAIAIGTVVVALKLWQAGVVLVSTVTKIAAAVQMVFNAIMAANPIGIIVLAIAGLVAGLVFFFTKTKTGQRIWKAFSEALSAGWEWIKNAFVKGYNAIKSWLGKAFEFIKKVWSFTPLGLIVTNWGKIIDFFKGLPRKIGNAVSGMWNGIKDSFKAAINWIIGKWNDFKLTIGGGTILGKKLPSITLNTPNIPMLATGGTIKKSGFAIVGERGPELAHFPAGTTVYPNGTGPIGMGTSGVVELGPSTMHRLVDALSQQLALYADGREIAASVASGNALAVALGSN